MVHFNKKQETIVQLPYGHDLPSPVTVQMKHFEANVTEFLEYPHYYPHIVMSVIIYNLHPHKIVASC